MLLERAEEIEVLGQAGDGDEALALTLAKRPDVLVLDLNMPGRPSIEVIEELTEAAPEVAVVVLTMEQDPGLAQRALDRGARGYLLKKAAEDELLGAIRTAADGSEHVSGDVRLAINRRAREDSAAALSTRELEVLELVALGHTNPEIAERLEISVRTVESHRMHIVQKTGLNSRPELVRFAIDRHLI